MFLDEINNSQEKVQVGVLYGVQFLLHVIFYRRGVLVGWDFPAARKEGIL